MPEWGVALEIAAAGTPVLEGRGLLWECGDAEAAARGQA
jgi:hypothetical protein